MRQSPTGACKWKVVPKGVYHRFWESFLQRLLLLQDELPGKLGPRSKHTPLTCDVATAISNMSPKLKCLWVTYGVDIPKENDPRPPSPTPGDVDHATASARLLLQLVGPRLTDLHLMPDGRHWPARALDSLSYCTALTKLKLRCNLPEGGPEDGLAGE